MVKLGGLGKRKNITSDIPANNKKQISDEEFAQRVEKKAYELYEQRGGNHGGDWDDWFTAEQMVRDEIYNS